MKTNNQGRTNPSTAGAINQGDIKTPDSLIITKFPDSEARTKLRFLAEQTGGPEDRIAAALICFGLNDKKIKKLMGEMVAQNAQTKAKTGPNLAGGWKKLDLKIQICQCHLDAFKSLAKSRGMSWPDFIKFSLSYFAWKEESDARMEKAAAGLKLINQFKKSSSRWN